MITNDKREYYMEVDRNYYNDIKTIYKYEDAICSNSVFYTDSKNVNIIEGAVIKKGCLNYLIMKKDGNFLECVIVKRKDNKFNKKGYVKIEDNGSLASFIDLNKKYLIDADLAKYEYFIPTNLFHEIFKLYKQNNEKDEKLKFGNVVYINDSNQIVVLQKERFIYTCPLDSLEQFRGFNRYSTSDVIINIGALSKNQEEVLLKKLENALNEDKHILKKIKQDVKKLV